MPFGRRLAVVALLASPLLACGRIDFDRLGLGTGTDASVRDARLPDDGGPDGRAPDAVTHEWSTAAGGMGTNHGHGIAVGLDGHVFVGGHHLDDLDFGGGGIGSGDAIFAASFDRTGAHRWSRSFAGGDGTTGNALATTSAGDLLLIGEIETTADFGGGPLTSNGGWDAYVAAIGDDGTHRWSFSFGGPGNDTTLAVTTSPSGGVYAVGRFEDTIDLPTGPLTSVGGSDVVVLSITSAGRVQWARRFGGPDDDSANGIGVDDLGRLYVAGRFAGTVDFGGGPRVADGTDGFVMGLTPDGEHRWSVRIGGASVSDDVNGLAVSGAGVSYATGYVEGVADLGAGPTTGGRGQDMYLTAFDASGSHLWSVRTSGSGDEAGIEATLDQFGNIFVCAAGGTADYGGGTLAQEGGEDAVVASYSPDGTHRWSLMFGGPELDVTNAIDVDDADGSVWVTGFFHDIADFGGPSFTDGGLGDVYVVKLGPVP